MLIIGVKTQERKMTDQIKKNRDIKEDQERLKGQGEKENRKYLCFILYFFDRYTVLRSSF